MFKPKKLAKYCTDCGKPITIRIYPIKYDSETGKITKERHMAGCWNVSYADELDNRHYQRIWYITI